MRFFSQARNETVVINGEIFVTVVDIRDDEVVLAIDAPEWIQVSKKEAVEELELMLVRPR
jgi:carbon storage regulator CsrA